MARTKIPGAVMDEVRLRSVDRCCVCERRGQHIHHMNGNNSDHDLDNLALLCFTCHDRATRGPGLGHGLGERTIRAFRERWYLLVAERAARFARRPSAGTARTSRQAEDLPNALLSHEVRKLRWAISRASSGKWDWQAIASHVGDLWEYAREGNAKVQGDVLEAIHEVVSMTRFGMHYDVAEKITNIITELIPLPHRRRVGASRDAREDEKRVERILGLLWNLGYDAIIYNKNLAIVETALDPLKWIYRYAEVNGIKRLQTKASEKFKELKETAQREPWKEAEQLVDHEFTNAPKVGTGWESSPSAEIEKIVENHRSLPPGRRIDRERDK